MNLEDKQKKSAAGFIKYWRKKRDSKVKYSLLSSFYFSLPLSLLLWYFLYGFQNLMSLKFLLIFNISFSVYYFISYRFLFTIQENRYQNLLDQYPDL